MERNCISRGDGASPYRGDVCNHEEEYHDWFHDAESTADWVDDTVITSMSKDGIRQATYEELQKRNKQLEETWRQHEDRYQRLIIENERLNTLFLNEKNRAKKYQKRLQYITENQEIFEKLKKSYMLMKNAEKNKTHGPSIDKNSQTLDVEEPENENEPTIWVTKTELEEMHATIENIRSIVIDRQIHWCEMGEKEAHYQMEIKKLGDEIRALKLAIKSKKVKSEIMHASSILHSDTKIDGKNQLLKATIHKLQHRIKGVCASRAGEIFADDLTSSALQETRRKTYSKNKSDDEQRSSVELEMKTSEESARTVIIDTDSTWPTAR